MLIFQGGYRAMGSSRGTVSLSKTKIPPVRATSSRHFKAWHAEQYEEMFQHWVSPNNGLVDAIGKTPLIRLRTLSKESGCEILAKAEWMNPGGSVKDRAAVFIIKHAEDHHLLKPGGTVVEGTAGNTGIGMAHVCNARGYKLVIFMPDNQSKEKVDLLRTLGAQVHQCPVVPITDPNNYNNQAKRFAESNKNTVWGNQFDNIANRRGHYATTGPEIWEQTDGTVTAWTCGTGTGGTFAGVGDYLKEKSKDITCYIADPPGSVLYSYFTRGKLERTGTGSITEGIGQGRVTENLKGAHVDGALHIEDKDTIRMVFRMLHEEGIFMGASSAMNVVAAFELGKKLGKGHKVVTVICDGAARYQSRLFNKKWLADKELLEHIPERWHKGLN